MKKRFLVLTSQHGYDVLINLENVTRINPIYAGEFNKDDYTKDELSANVRIDLINDCAYVRNTFEEVVQLLGEDVVKGKKLHTRD
jgi:hypothetical protein